MDQDDLLASALRGAYHTQAMLELQTELLADRKQALIQYVIELINITEDVLLLSEEQWEQKIKDLWQQADTEAGRRLYSLLDENEQKEFRELPGGELEIWSYFESHIPNWFEEMAEAVYFFGLDYISNSLGYLPDISISYYLRQRTKEHQDLLYPIQGAIDDFLNDFIQKSVNKGTPITIELVKEIEYTMPYRILCNGELRKTLEARTSAVLTHSRFTPLHKTRYGV
jgi:hypothetical protein